MTTQISRGRPRKNAEFDSLVQGLRLGAAKRPTYVKGIGVFRGERGDTAWIKLHLRHPTTFRQRSYPAGSSLEIKAGKLASFTWDQLLALQTAYQGKADRGEPLETAPATRFDAWANTWLERARTRLRSYPIARVHVNEHLIPAFGELSLDAITVGAVNAWAARMLETQKPATVKRELGTLKAILNSAVREGLIETNPSASADPIRGITGRQRFLEGAELVTLLGTAQGVAEWLPDLILWGLHSGMRKSEVMALRWRDVRELDLGRIVIQIPHSKSGEPRNVPCTRTMVEVLARQRARQIAGNDHVFPIPAMTLRRKWEAARRLAGLEDVNLHDLRRTHSTYAAVAGVDLRTLAARIGHRDLTMLERHYAALVGTAAVEAATTIETALERLTTKPKAFGPVLQAAD